MDDTRTDGDVFIESKFAVQCYSNDPKRRGERNGSGAPQIVTPSDLSSFVIR